LLLVAGLALGVSQATAAPPPSALNGITVDRASPVETVGHRYRGYRGRGWGYRGWGYRGWGYRPYYRPYYGYYGYRPYYRPYWYWNPYSLLVVGAEVPTWTARSRFLRDAKTRVAPCA
jgi:hypothetical protein